MHITTQISLKYSFIAIAVSTAALIVTGLIGYFLNFNPHDSASVAGIWVGPLVIMLQLAVKEAYRKGR